MAMLDNSAILITGGTGSFGQRFIDMTLHQFSPRKIIVYSRDEMKQWEMAKKYKNDDRLRFFLGDVRDKDRLDRACSGVDYIVHAAASKIIPIAEYNPFECIKTNVIGAMNIIDCAIDKKVKCVVALSTDKACNPVNLYGATKLCSDKVFVSGNAYVGKQNTRFVVVRYGNVMGSRGSIIPFFKEQAASGVISITDERMTRFVITLSQSVELVWLALQDGIGGEIYVRKIPSITVKDIARAIAPNARLDIIGIRPGEKLHEMMITPEDSRTTLEYETYYKILPQIQLSEVIQARIAARKPDPLNGRPVTEGFSYSSDTNPWWISSEELKALMLKEGE